MRDKTATNIKGSGRPKLDEDETTYIYTKNKELEYVAHSKASAVRYLHEMTGYKVQVLRQYIKGEFLYQGTYFIADHLKWKSNTCKLSVGDIAAAQHWKFKKFDFVYED